MLVLKVKVISLPYIFQVLYVVCFSRPRYQVSVYRTISPLVVALGFYIPPTAKVIQRQCLGLKSHPNEKRDNKQCLLDTPRRVTFNNQRTNGSVNAHLISWPSKAQNIQNLDNIWYRNDLDLQYSQTFIISISCLHLQTFRSQAAIVSEKSTVFTFSHRKA